MKALRIIIAPAIALLAMATSVQAADWPTRELKFIVPLGPGGGGDFVSRVVAAELANRLGKPVVVENRPGASSNIGTRAIADAEPDGYTIGLFTNVHAVNVATGQQVNYDAEKELAFLTQVVRLPMQLLTNPKRNFKSVADIIAFGQKNPDALTASSIGTGTPHHFMSEWLAARGAIKMTVVPYKSIPDAMRAVMVGEADLTFMGVGANADELVAAGSLTRIATTAPSRLDRMATTPTMVEQGQAGFVEEGWYGIVTNAKTPPDIQKRLSDELRAVLASPDVQQKLRTSGATPNPTSQADFLDLVRRDTARYQEIVKTIKESKK
jgi:tripartite-type tricarboxylate transporter receptor subunit TctC